MILLVSFFFFFLIYGFIISASTYDGTIIVRI